MSNKLTKLSVLYYNSLFSAVALLVLFLFLPKEQLVAVITFSRWNQTDFVVLFVLAAVMGCILNYSIFLCTAINSALTTTVVGCLKNILTTYLGIIIGGDYQYTILNFVGLNVSIVGSLIYSWVTFKQ
jgi:solute carrier family 35 protein